MPDPDNPLTARLRLPAFEPGTVWIVGAGPGDPGLLTVLALRALDQAEVILHDALVDPAILDLAPRAARPVFVGKRGGLASPRQATINEILIARARAGARVLRLKGGDPFVFGRGAEEAAALRQAGIPFRIVPGVTAGIGGLAYAGIPLTQRGINSSVTLVTGHGRTGGLPDDLDWPSLAANPVIVFYMAVRTLPEIAARLLAMGRAAATPVALVSNATTPAQQTVETTLGQCTLDAQRHTIRAPALIVVGEVVAQRAALDWFQPGRLESGAVDAPWAERCRATAVG